MENEIKVNEFVRTKDGQIYKIEDGTEFYEDIVNVGIGIIPDVDGIWVDKEHFTYVDKRDIVKHSPNLKELIKVKDMIKIHNLKGDDISFWFEIFDDKTMMDFKLGLDSKEIEVLEVVTKEMMESISYKVKE